MRSSKIIKSLVFIVILIICSRILTFLLYPLSSLNKKFIDYHNEKQNIDFLVLGDSLEGNGLDAKILSEEMGMHAYVMSPQGSYPESLYELLVDIAHTHKVSMLLIGWDVLQNYQVPTYHYPHTEEIYREFLADIKGNPELTKIVFKGIMGQRYTSTFFDWSSFPENITQIPDVLKSKKILAENQQAEFVAEPIDINNIEKSSFNYHRVADPEYKAPMLDNDANYILKIKEYCKNHNIKLFVISSPIPNLIMEEKPELNECIKDTYDFMNKNNIKYIHGNNQDYFPKSMELTNFKDFPGHIIMPYRNKYSKYVCDWIKSVE